jgi:hypothetical protein
LVLPGVAGLSVAALAVLVGLPAQTASAACAGPIITVSPNSGAPGAALVVNGQSFLDGCNDTSVNGQPPAPTPPAKGITITFNQNGRSWSLGSVDAGTDYKFSFKTSVPLEVTAGSSVIEASGATADFTVTRARAATPIRRQPSVTG